MAADDGNFDRFLFERLGGEFAIGSARDEREFLAAGGMVCLDAAAEPDARLDLAFPGNPAGEPGLRFFTRSESEPGADPDLLRQQCPAVGFGRVAGAAVCGGVSDAVHVERILGGDDAGRIGQRDRGGDHRGGGVDDLWTEQIFFRCLVTVVDGERDGGGGFCAVAADVVAVVVASG